MPTVRVKMPGAILSHAYGTVHRQQPNPQPAGVNCCGVPPADRAMFASEEGESDAFVEFDK